MENLKLIIPTEPINQSHAWQFFLDLHNLRGKVTNETYDLYEEWLTKIKTFKPQDFMPISPSNSGFNH